MLSNYIKIAWRTLLKYKGYAAINLFGLAFGLTSGILILIYILDEVSFDKFHTQGERIYRVGTDMYDVKSGSFNYGLEANGWAIGALLGRDYPEVEKVVYISNARGLSINHEGKRFEERMFFAGPEFFSIFTFPLVAGNPATALAEPKSVVLSERMAEKYFNGTSPLGKTIVMADTLTLMVTGVMKDIPEQSHMQFDVLISFATYTSINTSFTYDGGWGNINMRNYVLLKAGVDHEAFFAKARNVYMDHVKEEMAQWGMYMYLDFEPLHEVYLNTTRGNGMGPLGSKSRLYLIGGIAVFVILLACINFVNLATARSIYRAKEVGLRKVVGSSRVALVRQFLSESFTLTFLAFVVSLALVGVLLPMFNQLVGKSYTLTALTHPEVIGGIALLIFIITMLAGYYPAIMMSSLKPAEVLKGKMQTSARGIQLRRVLVVFQFAISAGLIVSTLVVHDQISFMKNKDLGFVKDQVLVLDVSRVPANAANKFGASSNGVVGSYEVLKNEMLKFPQVEQVSFTNAVPGKPGWVGQWSHAADKSADETVDVEYMTIDENYIQTLGLNLIAGNNFDLSRTADLSEGLIINETAAQQYGWMTPEEAIGKKIDSPSKHPAGIVIGVVKDYHEFGLQQSIYPMVMDFNPQYSRYFAIRYQTAQTEELLANLETMWQQYYAGYDFTYFFLDDNFEKQYHAEQRLSTVFTVFAVITILIALIGLIGLVSCMVVARTKEIGIRKVLGADVLSISRLLSKEFMVLVILATALACPVAWYAMNEWLEGFAYRTVISWQLFAYTGVIALGITLVTVSIQTIRAALADPVDSLRYE